MLPAAATTAGGRRGRPRLPCSTARRSTAGRRSAAGRRTGSRGAAIVGEVVTGSKHVPAHREDVRGLSAQLDCKLDVPGNSGIQFRSHQDTNKRAAARLRRPVRIPPSPRAGPAGTDAEGPPRLALPPTATPSAKAFKLNDWNHFVIEARGPHLRTWLNGVALAPTCSTRWSSEGFIALQVHSGKAGKIRWKNITIVDDGQSHRPALL